MSGALPPSLRRPLTRRWPPLARGLVGAAIGWAIAGWLVGNPGPDWRVPAAATAMAAIAVGAPSTARAVALGGPPAWALASVVGLYLGLPETDHVLGLAAGLGVLVLAELTGRARTDAVGVVALGGVVIWGMLQGAGERESALVAGFGTLGLLVLWPVATRLPGPARNLVPRQVRPLLITALHGADAVLIGRRGAVEESARDVAVAAAVGAAVLVVATRLVVGGRHS